MRNEPSRRLEMVSFLILHGTQLDFTPVKTDENNITLVPLGCVVLERTSEVWKWEDAAVLLSSSCKTSPDIQESQVIEVRAGAKGTFSLRTLGFHAFVAIAQLLFDILPFIFIPTAFSNIKKVDSFCSPETDFPTRCCGSNCITVLISHSACQVDGPRSLRGSSNSLQERRLNTHLG